jgi:alkylation response protein AidB-like acyl-CoA dehydrogenase
MCGAVIDPQLEEGVGRLLRDRCPPEVVRAAEAGEPAGDLWKALEEAGVPLISVPEAAGGSGGTVEHACQVLTLAGRHAAPVPLAETALLAAWLLAGARLPIPSGPMTAGPLVPGERIDVLADDGGWTLSGTVTRLPWARSVDRLVLLAAGADDRNHVVSVPADSVRIEPGRNLAGEPCDTVVLDGVVVAPECAGLAPPEVSLERLRARGALARAALIAGALSQVRDLTVAHARERVQFGQPIIGFQAVQNLVVQVVEQAECAQRASATAAARFDSAPEVSAALAKSTTSRAARLAVRMAHQVLGAMGVTREHDLGLFSRRLHAWAGDFGSERHWNIRLGRHVLAAGADGTKALLLSGEHDDLRAEVREFLAAEWPWGSSEPGLGMDGQHSAEFSRKLAARGWLGMRVPPEYGGAGRSSLERFAVTEELLAAGAPVMASWVSDRQMAPSLLSYGSEAQRQRFLPAICRGECFFSIGMSEPDSGSDLASVRTTATKTDGGWLLNGTKLWTTYAHCNHFMMTLCRTSREADRHAGLSQFIVDLKSPGVTVRPISLLDGTHHFNEVVFDDAFVPDDLLVGEEGAGWRQITSELAHERAGPDRYLSTYTVFDAYLREHTAGAAEATDDGAEVLGSFVARLWSIRHMSLAVAAQLDSGAAPNVEAALVKDLGTVFEQDSVELLGRLFDGAPSPDGPSVFERLLARATLTAPTFTIRGGTTEILRVVAGRSLGGR